jgi:hypothetical protein
MGKERSGMCFYMKKLLVATAFVGRKGEGERRRESLAAWAGHRENMRVVFHWAVVVIFVWPLLATKG